MPPNMATASAVRFSTPYQNYDPATVFQVDPTTKTLKPFSSQAQQSTAGFTPGQERLSNPNDFAGYSVAGSQAQGLAQVTQQLNDQQNADFGATTAPKRASSAVAYDPDEELNTSLAKLSELTDKYNALQDPNYEQAYNDLRTQQGVPQLENDYANASQTLRELPYTERAQTGNAGLVTEGQLQDQTAQDTIPAEIKQANTLDRLQLAQDFINTSLSLKEKDADSARTAISNAINLVGQTIQIAQSQQDRQTAASDKGLQFRLDNNITTPFFVSGGTVYDAGTLQPVPDEATFQKNYGLSLQDAQAKGLVSDLNGTAKQEQALVLDLASSYPDAGILPSDTLPQAQGKIKNSAIYQRSVARPAGGSTSTGTLANSSIIDPSTDAGVASIIASKPGDGGYGDTYAAVAAKYGQQVANAYDSVFQDVFNNGTSVGAAFNNAKYKALTAPEVSQYQNQTNQQITQSVASLLPSVNSYTTGPTGKLTYKVPGTAAYNFNAQLDTLKSNIAFGTLTQMREASKTGGALGQVSDREEQLLSSTLGSLDIGQDPDQFKEQLKKIQKSIVTWQITAATGVEPLDIEVQDDGSVWQKNQDGSLTQIQ
jgi:hypothetical protein